MNKQATIELLNSNALKYRKSPSRKPKVELLKQHNPATGKTQKKYDKAQTPYETSHGINESLFNFIKPESIFAAIRTDKHL